MEDGEDEDPEFDLVGEGLAGEFSRTFNLDDLEQREGDDSDEEDPEVIQVEAPKKVRDLAFGFSVAELISYLTDACSRRVQAAAGADP